MPGSFSDGIERAADVAEAWANRCEDDRLPVIERHFRALAKTLRAEAAMERETAPTIVVQMTICQACARVYGERGAKKKD